MSTTSKAAAWPSNKLVITLEGEDAEDYQAEKNHREAEAIAEAKRKRRRKVKDEMNSMKRDIGGDEMHRRYLTQFLMEHNRKVAAALGIPIESFPEIEVSDEDLDIFCIF